MLPFFFSVFLHCHSPGRLRPWILPAMWAFCSIALDSNDKPHISYYDATNDRLKYYNGATGSFTSPMWWSSGKWTSIAVDSNNDVHISHSNTAGVGYYTSTNFFGSGSGTTGFAFFGVEETSILSGTSGAVQVPFIAYYQGGLDKLYFLEGNKWSPLSTPSPWMIDTGARSPSLARHVGNTTSHELLRYRQR